MLIRPSDPSAAGDPSSVFTGALLKVGCYFLFLAGPLLFLNAVGTLGYSLRFFQEQDFPVLAFGAAVLLAIHLRPDLLPRRPVGTFGPRSAGWLIAGVFLATAAGTWLVLGNYALTRDELLANFDADHFRMGRIIAPVPVEWRPFADAMMPLFMLPVAADAGWTSTYLPGNAALRALSDLAFGKEWTNPLLAVVAAFALYRIALRLWPDTPRTALVPLLLLATSSQFLATAMMPYAMTAHLAFNLLWLWCFLRNDRRGDLGALAAGFVATGLHQLVFHPVFVLPFIVELLIARDRRRAALFVGGYALIGLFWISYWQIALAASGLAAAAGAASAGGLPALLDQVRGLIATLELTNPLFMLLNLLRFAAWQHLLLVPLALLGWLAVRRAEGVARPLAMGIVLILAMTTILIPWQGHGWGYRYLHGFLGSVCLLAGHGWLKVASPIDRLRRDGALAVTTALTVVLVLPFQFYTAHAMVRPYARAQAAIARSPADVVVTDAPGLASLVRNAPDASNRPIIMDLHKLDEAQLTLLCSRYKVALFGRRQALWAGYRPEDIGEGSPKGPIIDGSGCRSPARGR